MDFFFLHLFACYNATDINRCSFNANLILFVEFHICSSLPNHTHSVFPSELISHSIQITLLFPLTHSLVHLCFGYGQYLNYTILAILCKSRSLMFVELHTTANIKKKIRCHAIDGNERLKWNTLKDDEKKSTQLNER